MKAIRFNRPMEAEIIDIPSPTLQPGEVRVKTGACAICGSDVLRYQDLAALPVFPIIPGHECSGTVVEVGPGTKATIGQRVAIMPIISCGECRACRTGHFNHCASRRIMGPGMPGGYAEEFVARTSMLRPIPDSLSFEEAALAEPVAVAVHAANRAPVRPGDRVAILGAGSIGMLLQQVVKAKGAAFVMSTGRTDKKLALARQLGADETVNITNEGVVTSERETSFDVVFDLVCDQSTVDQGLALAGRGGFIVFIAGPHRGHPAAVDLHNLNWVNKELRIARSSVYDLDFDEAVPLMASGKVQAGRIISHRYPLVEAAAALQEVIDNRAVVKAVLFP